MLLIGEVIQPIPSALVSIAIGGLLQGRHSIAWGDAVDEEWTRMDPKEWTKRGVHTVPEVALIGRVIQPIPVESAHSRPSYPGKTQHCLGLAPSYRPTEYHLRRSVAQYIIVMPFIVSAKMLLRRNPDGVGVVCSQQDSRWGLRHTKLGWVSQLVIWHWRGRPFRSARLRLQI